MRIKISPYGITLWLSATDTYNWATMPGKHWPCSFLRGKRLVAAFDSGGLCDLQINSGKGDQDCPSDEFNAITSDALDGKVPENHPAYFVTVGQFKKR